MGPFHNCYRLLRGLFFSFPRAMWIQSEITLSPRPRGFHLVTDEVVDGVPELSSLRVGIALVFMQHTSASLTLNENASPDVRRDFAAWFDRAVPDGADYFRHTLEGDDDMPAHIKSSLTGRVAGPARARGPAGPGDLAGDLPVRAPRQRRATAADRDRVRRAREPVLRVAWGIPGRAMSQENVERIKAGFAAHNSGDIDALVEVYARDAVVRDAAPGNPSRQSRPSAGSTRRTKRPCRATTSSPWS